MSDLNPIDPEGCWIFAYGSLLWNPGFEFVDIRPARLAGYHRSLCIYSHVHRGTPETPGLVLGLDRGGSCLGAAYRVAPGRWAPTIDYLRKRELVTAVYREAQVQVRLEGGERASAITYIVDRTHAQYAGKLLLSEILAYVGQGHGLSGPNVDYVMNTRTQLTKMGIRDHVLESVATRLNASLEL